MNNDNKTFVERITDMIYIALETGNHKAARTIYKEAMVHLNGHEIADICSSVWEDYPGFDFSIGE